MSLVVAGVPHLTNGNALHQHAGGRGDGDGDDSRGNHGPLTVPERACEVDIDVGGDTGETRVGQRQDAGRAVHQRDHDGQHRVRRAGEDTEDGPVDERHACPARPTCGLLGRRCKHVATAT